VGSDAADADHSGKECSDVALCGRKRTAASRYPHDAAVADVAMIVAIVAIVAIAVVAVNLKRRDFDVVG